MSPIEELISELSPGGVEFRALGDVANYSTTRVDAAGLDETNFVGVDNLLSEVRGRTNASHLPNTDRLTAFEAGDVLLGNIRPYLKKVWLADRPGGCSGDVLAIRIRPGFEPTLHAEFLYYLLSSDRFFSYNVQHSKGAKMPRGSKDAILKYRIPLPPLALQREIVRVLDEFTELGTALASELDSELKARARQYVHYRDSLVACADIEGVRSTTIGELYESSSGLSKSADQFGFGQPFLSFKDVFNNSVVPSELANLVNSTEVEQSRFSIKAGDVFVTRTSEDLDGLGMSCAALEDYPKATFNGFTKRLRPKEVDVIDPKFAAYFFRSGHFKTQIARTAVLSTRMSLNDDILRRVRIALPPMDEQRRVVASLDSLDTSVNDLSIDLSAEIAARRSQYRHYRDRLLTFDEVTV